MAPAGSPQLSLNEEASGDDDVDFTVTPKGGVFLLGRHAIVFPARSICDPELSSYGEGTWETPCVPLRGALRIHATIRTTTLGTWVDFSRKLRFVPSDDPKRWVYLYMYTPNVIGATDLSKFSILWSPAIGASGVNDAAGNAKLRTYVDTKRGISMRVVLHWTGYLTSSGRSCDPAVDANCVPAPL